MLDFVAQKFSTKDVQLNTVLGDYKRKINELVEKHKEVLVQEKEPSSPQVGTIWVDTGELPPDIVKDTVADFWAEPFWDNITDKPSTFPPSSHSHDSLYYLESEVDTLLATQDEFKELGDTPGSYAGEEGKFVKVNATPDALIFASIAWDDVLKAGSDLADLATRQHAGLTDITSGQHHAQLHGSSHHSGGGDAIKLDDLASPDDNTDLNATTVKHGLLMKLGGGTVNFLRADGTWSAQAPGAHASAHEVGGGDLIDGILSLAQLGMGCNPAVEIHIRGSDPPRLMFEAPGQGTNLKKYVIASSIASGGDLVFSAYNDNDTVKRHNVVFTNAGNVLIGTTTLGDPVIQLTLRAGDIAFEQWSDGTNSIQSSLDRGGSPGYAPMLFYGSKHIFNVGNMGIMTATPGYMLTLGHHGSMEFEHQAHALSRAMGFVHESVGYARLDLLASNAMDNVLDTVIASFYANGTIHVPGAIQTSSAVYSFGSYAFYAINQVSATGTTVVRNANGWYYDLSSTHRHKKDIEEHWTPGSGVLKEFLALDPIQFAYKADPKVKTVGFLAEDLSALPFMVNYDKKNKPYSIREHTLFAYIHLIQQDHEARIKELEARLDN